MSPCLFISVAAVVAGTLSYTMFWSFSSWAASLASLSAALLPSIPMWAFTHPKWIVQFSVDRCRILFLVSSVKKLCMEWFLSESIVTLLSVKMATILPVGSSSFGRCSRAFRIAICSAWLLEQKFCSLYLHCVTSCLFEYIATPAPTLPPSLLPSV